MKFSLLKIDDRLGTARSLRLELLGNDSVWKPDQRRLIFMSGSIPADSVDALGLVGRGSLLRDFGVSKAFGVAVHGDTSPPTTVFDSVGRTFPVDPIKSSGVPISESTRELSSSVSWKNPS